MNLSDLTLVVPTYNRQDYALRQMTYWDESSVTLHILDGTNRPIPKDHLQGFNKNIHYHHIPKSYEERLKQSLEFIDTPYVALLCDDEFYIPSALEHCIDTLKKNNELVACIGRCLGFSDGLGIPMYPLMKGYTCVWSTPDERMIHHMNPYVQSIQYAVHHTPIWKQSINVLSAHHYSSPDIPELLFELATCYQGKSVVIDELMWLRNMENNPIETKGWNRSLQIDTWCNDPRYADEVGLLFNSTPIPMHLKLSFESYLRFCKHRWMDMPKNILRKISLNQHKPLMRAAEDMIEQGVTIDMIQFYEIVTNWMKNKKAYKKGLY